MLWNSQKFSFRQAVENLKDKFKIVDVFILKENFNSHFEYEFTPSKIDSHPTIFLVYDIKTHNTDRARLYCICFYRLGEVAGRYNCDLSQYEVKKCKKDTFDFDGDACIIKAKDYSLKFKGEERKVKNKNIEHNLQLHAQNGSGFDA